MELAINNLIKLILGLLVVVAVVGGVYLFFKTNVLDFFNNGLPSGQSFFLGLI